jgi:hypothetical protein
MDLTWLADRGRVVCQEAKAERVDSVQGFYTLPSSFINSQLFTRQEFSNRLAVPQASKLQLRRGRVNGKPVAREAQRPCNNCDSRLRLLLYYCAAFLSVEYVVDADETDATVALCT